MTRPSLLPASLALVLGASALALAPTASGAPSVPLVATVQSAPEDGPVNTFFSTPPDLMGRTSTEQPSRPARPKPPKTKGKVTGQVVGPKGTPIRNALVTGIRFSDLGLPVDLSEEKRVLARTDAGGRFTLKQLREPYLVRVCSESVSSGGGGHRAVRSGECDQETSKRFTPSYVGPDGTLNSWMRHTRMFQPQQPGRSLGRIVVQPPAVVAGTFKDGANRRVYLTRIDGSIAAQTISDDDGRYRFEVAPGPYRVEADHDEGLRTEDTVPGYQSKRLVLRSGRTKQVSFRTRHAGIIRGLVSTGGTPLRDQFLAILDKNGDFAAGVVTNEIGRYVVSSLRPGIYTVTTSYAGSAFVPKAQQVTVTKKTVATVDLPLETGRQITFSAADLGGNGSVDAELRNADGRVVKVHQGDPSAQVVFSGLPQGTYRLYLRRTAVPSDVAEQVDFPWAQRAVDLTVADSANLGPVVLDQPTVNLVGTLPHGSQVKLTAVPEDTWLRPSHVDGDQATPMALNWTEQEAGGQYVVRGIVPGTYAAALTTALKEREDRPSTTRANLATTHSTISVDGPAPTASFTAPKGAKVRGQLRYDSNNRLVIAPFGYRVTDGGDRSWLFPTVSDKQRFGKGFRVERLHAGKATGKLLDLDALYAEHPDTLVPDTLVSSARNEPGTAYWFTSGKRSFTLDEGGVLDLGVIRLKLHGVLGVHSVLGRQGR